MRILFNNVDFGSRSGPNGFGLKLAKELSRMGHKITNDSPDVALNFIQGHCPGIKNVLRLDGIYFNTSQDWQKQNEPIRMSYNLADAVVVQSHFNRELVFHYFGGRENVHVIHNGTSLEEIAKIEPAQTGMSRERIWFCASSWRPHKRLTENIAYFQCHAKQDDVLLIAGSGDIAVLDDCSDPRVRYLGDLNWYQMISVMKASLNFIHLAYLDHCPNVVVDARACGCEVIVSSSGGTKEIAGENAKIIKEEEWCMDPVNLQDPPRLDFSYSERNIIENSIDITKVAELYANLLFQLSG